jgi:uncharacterized membrane protein
LSSPIVVTALAYAHILSGVCWLGGALIFVTVVAPGLGRMSGAARSEFIVKVMPRWVKFIQAVAGLTLLFGILLLVAYFNGDYSSIGASLMAGVVFGILAFLVVIGLTGPTFRKLVKLVEEMQRSGAQAPSPEIEKTLKRSVFAGRLGLVLLLLALLFMVAAGFY